MWLQTDKFGLSCPRIQIKPLRGKVWEVKFRAAGGGYRLLYVMITAEEMVVLHAFKKKTRKTPAKDLDLAGETSEGDTGMKKKRKAYRPARGFVEQQLRDPEIRVMYEQERARTVPSALTGYESRGRDAACTYPANTTASLCGPTAQLQRWAIGS
jgi:hypothetical protein